MAALHGSPSMARLSCLLNVWVVYVKYVHSLQLVYFRTLMAFVGKS